MLKSISRSSGSRKGDDELIVRWESVCVTYPECVCFVEVHSMWHVRGNPDNDVYPRGAGLYPAGFGDLRDVFHHLANLHMNGTRGQLHVVAVELQCTRREYADVGMKIERG